MLGGVAAAGLGVARGCVLAGWTSGVPDWLWQVPARARAAVQTGQQHVVTHVTHVTLRPLPGAITDALEHLRNKV